MAQTLTFSEQLRVKISLAAPRLAQASHAIFAHRNSRAIYPHYLCCLHSMIRASVPIMCAALEASRARMNHDPIAAILIRYFEQHISEEKGHDEWLIDDLEILGVRRNVVVELPPSASVAMMVGAQYYWICHYNPVIVLGYIFAMECAPPTGDWVRSIAAAMGLPTAAFRTLLAHADADLGHHKELSVLLNLLPLDRSLQGLIVSNAIHTYELASAAFDQVMDSYELTQCNVE